MADPLQLTITPGACPWGFNTANRAPTELEQQQHQLCLMEQSIAGSDTGVSAGTRSLIDSLWADLQSLWQWVSNGLDQAVIFIGDAIQSLWNGIGLAWQALKNELGTLQNWALGLLALAVVLFFSPELGEGISNAKKKHG